MIDYPFVNMPDYFTTLLKVNMQTSTNAYTQLPSYVEKHPPFTSLVNRVFVDDSNGGEYRRNLSIRSIVKSLGWQGFRDRVAALFIEKEAAGTFPLTINLKLVNEILEFEDETKVFSVEGYSRSFLLYFYLKLAILQINKEDPDADVSQILIPRELIELIKPTKSKIVMVDWLLLMLNHYRYFFGMDELKRMIEQNTSYEDLYRSLSENEQKLLIRNYLSYGASIGESDIFYQKVV